MNKQKYLQLNVLVLKACSMYPCDDDANRLQKVAHVAYQSINVATFYFVMIPCIYEITLGEKPGGVTAYSLHIVMAFAYGCSTLTLHFFHTQGKVARDLIAELNETFKFECDGETGESNMAKSKKVTRTITLGFTTLTTCAVLMMSLVPLFIKSQEKLLPIPGIYPGNYKQSPVYEIVYIIQAYTQVIVGGLTGAGDSFFISIVLTAAAQFGVLAYDFHNCVYNTLAEYNLSKDTIFQFKEALKISQELFLFGSSANKMTANEPVRGSYTETTSSNLVFDVINSKSFNIKLNKLFITYIKHHQKLLSFCVKLERFFFPFILMKAATSMFYNIFITFALVTSNNASMAFTLAQYELCALMEIFIYAMAGQALITESENLRAMVYSSPWYICNKNYKFLMFMVLMRSGRAVKISVGKLYDMSLATFIMIMKTAMSYLAVLRQVTD